MGDKAAVIGWHAEWSDRHWVLVTAHGRCSTWPVQECKQWAVHQDAAGNHGTDLVNDQTASVSKSSLQPLDLCTWCRHSIGKCCCNQQLKYRVLQSARRMTPTIAGHSAMSFMWSSAWFRAASRQTICSCTMLSARAKRHSIPWVTDPRTEGILLQRVWRQRKRLTSALYTSLSPYTRSIMLYRWQQKVPHLLMFLISFLAPLVLYDYHLLSVSRLKQTCISANRTADRV